MNKIKVFYACGNGGDGSIYLNWFLTQDEASDWEESQDEGWGEDCTGSVETFEGSDIHIEALNLDK